MASTPQQEHLRGLARDFVKRHIPLSLAREIDREDRYPYELLEAFGATGLWGVNIPETYGGMGLFSVDAMPIYEELSRGMPTLAWVIGNIMLYGNDIINSNGSQEQKERFLPLLAQGKLHFSFALTEPNAGSDAANVACKAVPADGGYRITGEKMFITGAGVSDWVVTLTRTAPSRHGGLTSFLVDTRSPGYSAKPLHKLGYHGSNTCAVHYDQVLVPAELILGGESALNQGWQQMVNLLNSERLALSACALGIGQAALEATIAYAREHYQPAAQRDQYQAVRHTIVEMATELEAARRLAYHAADLVRAGADCLRETSMSKLYCTETAKGIALRGLELLGAAGGTFEFDLQRYLRDVLVLTIGGGTSQIQKNIIAKTLGL